MIDYTVFNSLEYNSKLSRLTELHKWQRTTMADLSEYKKMPIVCFDLDKLQKLIDEITFEIAEIIAELYIMINQIK